MKESVIWLPAPDLNVHWEPLVRDEGERVVLIVNEIHEEWTKMPVGGKLHGFSKDPY